MRPDTGRLQCLADPLFCAQAACVCGSWACSADRRKPSSSVPQAPQVCDPMHICREPLSIKRTDVFFRADVAVVSRSSLRATGSRPSREVGTSVSTTALSFPDSEVRCNFAICHRRSLPSLANVTEVALGLVSAAAMGQIDNGSPQRM